MRGVRMLLEITKPELVLDKQNIISTIIVFGGAKIMEESIILIFSKIKNLNLITGVT